MIRIKEKARSVALGLLIAVVLAAGCNKSDPPKIKPKAVPEIVPFVVAADHSLASKAGAEMLKKGGNVVDAALATSFALSVVRPYSTGLGGGGFMLIKLEGSEPVALDYREIAPGSATASAYMDSKGNVIPDKTVIGRWSVGVPSLLLGLHHAHSKYGSLPMDVIVTPAIEAARDGFEVDSHTHGAMSYLAEQIQKLPVEPYAEISRIFLKDGVPYKVGETLRQPDLARSLEKIAVLGIEKFLEQELIPKILEDMKSHGGPIVKGDFENYRVKTRTPLKTRFREFDVLGMPPPSSGGACLQQVLNVMDGIDLQKVGVKAYYHVLAESMQHAFADRAEYLGDSDFHPEVIADVEKMLDPDHAAAIRGSIDPSRTADPDQYGQKWLKADHGTSHFSILDANGNGVAGTETINFPFGSFVVPKGTGIVLNNELDDFVVKTDVSNVYGLLMSKRNVINPGQRPLSSMSPTLILKDGRVILAAGASGGPRIITATLQTILKALDFGEPLEKAVSARRIHHQWRPDVLTIEKGFAPEIIDELKKKGHKVDIIDGNIGVCQITAIIDGKTKGASDPRKGGRPAGSNSP